METPRQVAQELESIVAALDRIARGLTSGKSDLSAAALAITATSMDIEVLATDLRHMN